MNPRGLPQPLRKPVNRSAVNLLPMPSPILLMDGSDVHPECPPDIPPEREIVLKKCRIILIPAFGVVKKIYALSNSGLEPGDRSRTRKTTPPSSCSHERCTELPVEENLIALLSKLIKVCKIRSTSQITGNVSADDQRLLDFAHHMPTSSSTRSLTWFRAKRTGYPECPRRTSGPLCPPVQSVQFPDVLVGDFVVPPSTS